MIIKSTYNNKCPHPVYKKEGKYNRSDNFSLSARSEKTKDYSPIIIGYGCTVCDIPPPYRPSFDAGRKCR